MGRFFAVISLTAIYFVARWISKLTKPWIRSKRSHRRIIVNGTFHNPNWFHAHITPLVNSGFGEVILICDVPIVALPNLIYRCPPDWANTLFSRAGAKAIWTFIQGIKTPADIYIGYHIFPSAVTALCCARLFGAKAIYQITSGPLELEGGGWHAENKLLVALEKPSNIVESNALSLMREFDVAVVRGSSAKNYILANGFDNRIEVITGSIETNHPIPIEKDIDLIFVGRLAEYKRPDRLLEVILKISKKIPRCCLTIVGDGPDRSTMEKFVKDANLENNVKFLGQRDDVPTLVARARVFILTSRWEGVSIAMLEAMSMNAVPVVSDVGDLKDYAQNNLTGFVVEEDDIDLYAEHITTLLMDSSMRERMAAAGRRLVIDNCDRLLLAKRWGQCLSEVKSQ
ncbi:MAG: glycosyltransferase family 4 protein [Pseudomonadales bacterium]|nr:glycosyltransferase family 4 protein [Pseudomonadales bacterium]